MRLVFDLEANGLYDNADKIWCIVAKDIGTDYMYSFDNSSCSKDIELGIGTLEEADEIIGHNIIDYDLRLIKKLYPSFKPRGKVFDTMILSQLLNPDRIGGHSLGRYGEDLGHKKPEHEDWSVFSPEMLHRCTEDVHINHKVYNLLIKESYEPVEGINYGEIFTRSI